uniref:Uncharacterized protein n=1 Tax=Anguilla anguilla TaxID=7936 RepID=A0A0E9V2L0_ANGAN
MLAKKKATQNDISKGRENMLKMVLTFFNAVSTGQISPKFPLSN